MGPRGLTTATGWVALGVGAIAAGVAGAHGHHRVAAVICIGVAAAQFGWGGLMLTLDVRRRLSLGGAIGSAAALVAVAVVAVVVPGEAQADGDEPEHGHHGEGTEEAVEARPFDPKHPIDLGGMPGVTPEQQARAENLLALTLSRLPRFSTTEAATAAGYRSIGDSLTGEEHYVNRSLLDDGRILDPAYPESLVYEVGVGQERTLQGAMFMLPPGSTWDDVPDIGGPLTQWHIHNNLCFTPGPEPKVAGVTGADTPCDPPLVKGDPVPMIHVWITPNPCGPFAALRGIGAGQIQEGETRLCDHIHGEPL